MTPMIDMTFQLIAFFMVLINFSEVEQDQRITLPASELAKPPEVGVRRPAHGSDYQVTRRCSSPVTSGRSTRSSTPLMREAQVIRDYGETKKPEATSP